MEKISDYKFSVVRAKHHIADKAYRYKPEDILSRVPQSLLYVLDFALDSSDLPAEQIRDAESRYLGTQFKKDGREVINLDHHNEFLNNVPNFSTTHQVLSGLNEGLLKQDFDHQMVVLNHDDTDSVLPLLLMTHEDVPEPVKHLFSMAARAADHTGESIKLVDVIDVFYKTFNFGQLIPLINALISGQELKFPHSKLKRKYEKLQELPEIMTDLVTAILQHEHSPYGTGSYDPHSQILHVLPHDSEISTIRLLPIVEKLGIAVRLVMTSLPKNDKSGDWNIGLRSGPHFPADSSLMELADRMKLKELGYGGRRNAGGFGRLAGYHIQPKQLLEMLNAELCKL